MSIMLVVANEKKPFSTAKLENIPSVYIIVTDIELQTQQHFQFWYRYL